MAYDPTKHHRQSMRLQGFDYSSAGAYFITLCTQNRVCLFGDIVDGAMVLNAAGQMIDAWWITLNQKFPGIQTDESVVMPNHFHGIVVINPPPVGAAPCVCPDPGIEDATDRELLHGGDEGEPMCSPLPRVMQWFKTMTTNHYIRGVKENGWMPFEKRVWQRNYYDHIIRSEADLIRIQTYIRNNPASWHGDQLHPQILSKW
jgi:putative transposase